MVTNVARVGTHRPRPSVFLNYEQPRDLESLGLGRTVPPLNNAGSSGEGPHTCPFAPALTRLVRGSTVWACCLAKWKPVWIHPNWVWTAAPPPPLRDAK